MQGLKFLTFPYLLTMQLKRFDFDYTTMHRIKLNDRSVSGLVFAAFIFCSLILLPISYHSGHSMMMMMMMFWFLLKNELPRKTDPRSSD